MSSGSLTEQRMMLVAVDTERYSVTFLTLGDSGLEQPTYLLMEEPFMLM